MSLGDITSTSWFDGNVNAQNDEYVLNQYYINCIGIKHQHHGGPKIHPHAAKPIDFDRIEVTV